MTSNAGFTLIEVLLASVIFAIVSALTYGALHATFQTQRVVNQRTELQETGTAILNKIREDLSQTFTVESPKPLTLFKGEDNLDHDRIVFTALAHYPSGPDAKESDQTAITYETESNPKQNQFFILKRKETPYIDGTDKVEAESVTIADNVMAFNLEYSDGQKTRPTWDIRTAEQLNKLPKTVRVFLKMKDARDREEIFETIVDLPMAEGLGIQTATPVPTQTPNPGPR